MIAICCQDQVAFVDLLALRMWEKDQIGFKMKNLPLPDGAIQFPSGESVCPAIVFTFRSSIKLRHINTCTM
jgi:hypothetical protein